MSLIKAENIWSIWAVIATSVSVSIYLEKHYKWAAKTSALVLALLSGIVLSNLNVIPQESAVYDMVWDYLVPLALPLLLFKVNLKKIFRESGQMLVAFLIGAMGTIAGAFLAFTVFQNHIPELSGLTAMMTGTYIGGSVNFMALASVFDVSGEMVSSATIADNLNMAIYFFVLLAIPIKERQKVILEKIEKQCPEQTDNDKNTSESMDKAMSITSLSVCLATGLVIITVSSAIANLCGAIIPEGTLLLTALHGLLGNKYLWITTVSVIGATAFPRFFSNIQGGQEIGTYIIYCFMFVIGAPASIMGIIRNSPLLLFFAMTIVVSNMVFTFIGGSLLHIDRKTLIIASNANIGGPTTAASMAIAKGWDDLVGPALLIGSFGYVIGNYLGMMMGYMCQ